MEPENLMMMEVIRDATAVINDLYAGAKNKEVKILEEALWRACNKIKKLQKELTN